MKNKKFVVIDGNSVVHRAFHAMPPLTNRKGEAVGAAHGFFLALLRAIEDFRPDYLAVCFDTKGGTFREKSFAGYKAQRPATPPELIRQLETVQSLLVAGGVAVFAMADFEADDLIASVVAAAKTESGVVDFFILTGDYDSLQLVDGRVKAFIVNRGIKNAVIYDAAKVKEKFGVLPAQIPALKALAGDASDNIPGAPGIGPKAAVEILSKCGTLERAFAEIETSPDGFCFGAGKRGENLKNILLRHKEQILDFQKLASMMADAPLGAVLGKCDFKNFSAVRARAALLERGLAGIAKRLPAAGAGVNRTLF